MKTIAHYLDDPSQHFHTDDSIWDVLQIIHDNQRILARQLDLVRAAGYPGDGEWENFLPPVGMTEDEWIELWSLEKPYK